MWVQWGHPKVSDRLCMTVSMQLSWGCRSVQHRAPLAVTEQPPLTGSGGLTRWLLLPGRSGRCPTSCKTVTAIGTNWRPFCQAQQGEQEPKGMGDEWNAVPSGLGALVAGLGMLVAGCGGSQCHCPLQATPPRQGVSPATANQS